MILFANDCLYVSNVLINIYNIPDYILLIVDLIYIE